MASAMVLKALEGLSDRQAADALRCNIRWKVATGLPLDHPGLHFTVFTYWRTRMAASGRPERIKEAVAEVISATGVLAGRRRRALDSTLLDDAVATQDTVTQLISAIRGVRRLIPEAAAVEVSAHDYDSVAKPVIAWDDPLAKQGLVSDLVNDAMAIIAALDGVELTAAQADALGLLALVAGQDVEPGQGEGTWRIARRVAPDRVVSTVDPEARHMHKSPSEYRDGYKAHVAVEPETGLILAAGNHRSERARRCHRRRTARRRGTGPTGPGRHRLRLGRGPGRPAPGRPRPGHQGDAVATGGPRRLRPRRLRHRPHRSHRHLPRW